MPDISDLAKQLLTEAPGCPAVGLQRELRWSARTFCEKTKYWRQDLDAIDSEQNIGTYALAFPAALIVDVLQVKHNDIPLDRKYENAMDRCSATWRTDTASQATGYLWPSENQVILYPAPNADVAGAIKAKVALKPVADALTLPDILVNNYLDALLAGAKSRLLKIPNTPWTDPNMASYYLSLFLDGVDEARAQVAKFGADSQKSTIVPAAVY